VVTGILEGCVAFVFGVSVEMKVIMLLQNVKNQLEGYMHIKLTITKFGDVGEIQECVKT
jgi:hypothetical protein